jgi:hypothetical protein
MDKTKKKELIRAFKFVYLVPLEVPISNFIFTSNIGY